MLGIIENKINLGCTDKNIQEYANNKKEKITGPQEKEIENMIKNLNLISKLNKNDFQISFNKRYLKYLFLICAFSNLNFKSHGKEILQELNILNEKLSSFNSAKKI